VAIINTPEIVVIGADSLVSEAVADSPGHWHINKIHLCKIHIVDGVAFSTSGIPYDKNAKFDALQIITDAISKGSNVWEGQALASKIEGPLLLAVKLLHKTLSPADYDKLIGKDKSALAVAIVGTKEKHPSFMTIEFIIENDCTGEPIKIRPNIFTSSLADYSIMGSADAATKLIKAGGFWTTDHVANVRKILDTEIKDAPEDVGPPVDVLTLDAIGMRWLPPYGQCHSQ
jgi:hypothetical protein